ncbi:MAG: cell envelope integrity protein CreD [Campylobacteraceae bacterium]|jgi:inner membrane protein|nr:cell envelope integrity protein CreD [Campylobacteraceae bacterium]
MRKTLNKAILFKTITIAIMILLMLIPLIFVANIINDRSRYKNEAVFKITDSWGKQVILAAPVLNIPYAYDEITETFQDNRAIQKLTAKTAYAKFAPHDLNVDVKINSQIRYIGIFEVPVFNADITMSGFFETIDMPKRAFAEDAFISLETKELKGISEPVFTWNETPYKFEPGFAGNSLSLAPLLKSGDHYLSYGYNAALNSLNSKIDFKNEGSRFELKFSIKGSESISFVPLAKKNRFHMSSDWVHPSFAGAFLPDEKNITDKGFEALWDINYLSSGVPPRFDKKDLSKTQFQTSFLIPVDNYRNAKRAEKYGILFIALTFIACFVFELANRRPIHPIQYLLVGFAMVIFYTLLISISEFIDFSLAYLLSAVAVISLIAAYAKFGIDKSLSIKNIAIIALALSFLYGYLYILLQLQDMALLYGSIGLFIALAVIMFMTRNINWYEEAVKED